MPKKNKSNERLHYQVPVELIPLVNDIKVQFSFKYPSQAIKKLLDVGISVYQKDKKEFINIAFDNVVRNIPTQ